MKNRFFSRKSNPIPHSSSVDSQLSQQQSSNRGAYTSNNSIDKPGLSLKPIGESIALISPTSPKNVESTNHNHLALLHSSLCQLSPISSSSTQQGIIGCANELFETNNSRWDGPNEMKLLAERKQSFGRRFNAVENEPSSSSNSLALIKCQEKKFSQNSFAPSMIGGANGSQQVADLVLTLAQQLAGKDAEIGRLRMQLKKSECRMDRACRELERDLERKAEELDASREQNSRLKKKLRNSEKEMEIVQRLNERIGREDQMGEDEEKKRLLEKNSKLKAKLGQQIEMNREKEIDWEKERKELKQSIQSLNGTLEELESEMRQRETREWEMQLEMERAIAQRDIAHSTGIGTNEDGLQQIRMPILDLPSPKTDSSLDGGQPCTSSTSSSGIGSLLLKELPDQKELDRALGMSKRRLAECRTKLVHLVRAAEKTQSGERLTREDLFGTSFLASTPVAEIPSPKSNSTLAAVEEHCKEIGGIRKDLELLHDKFTILYARGAIGH